ncbi:hypothetical protein [Oscillibacter sp.]|uniref:hypothetical protein n=1 Tax=Oscillibacter sp. TaxID=1945593 RepID=UPI00289A8958|nr:hypothetical protein [Oscillibacter sp.]
MNKINQNQLRLYEWIVFFVGWIIVFLLGADFPPPKGFLWLIALLAMLATIQDRQLKYLLSNIGRSPTFFKNFLFFFLGSICIAAVTSFIGKTQATSAKIIWIVIVTCVGTVYGIGFWLINKLLIKQSHGKRTR